MARKSKPRLYIRRFINRPGYHTVASVLATVDHGDYQFILSDCDRTIKLDFNAYQAAGRKNALYKVATLIDILSEFKIALEEEFKARPIDERDY